jgi:hypothetical protein
VVRVGGQGMGAQPLITVEGEAGVVEAGEQPWEVFDQLGVVARLVNESGIVSNSCARPGMPS